MAEIKNLEKEEANLKLKELAESIKVCLFCTKLSSTPFVTRPMAISQVDEDGKMWFLSKSDSHKNVDIQQDEKVQLIFADPSSSHFLSVYGEADIFTDEKSIEKAWTPLAKAWFTGGKDDPALTAIRIYPLDAHYWDTKDGKVISLIKIATAALTGTTMDGGVEGQLSVDQPKF